MTRKITINGTDIDVEVPVLTSYQKGVEKSNEEHLESLKNFQRFLIDLFTKSGIVFPEGSLQNSKLPYPITGSQGMFCFEIEFSPKSPVVFFIYFLEGRFIQIEFKATDPILKETFRQNKWLKNLERQWMKLDEFFVKFSSIAEFAKENS